MIHTTKIYLVTNCYGDPNKVYIGKSKNSRKNPHQQTYGKNITYDYIDEVDSLDRKYWGPLETYWIEQFRQWGFEVVNKNKKGGGGPEFFSNETKYKMSEKRKIQVMTPERNKKISESLKGRSLTLTHKENIGNSRKGIPSLSLQKPTFQYDLSGNLIKEWDFAKQAAIDLKLNYQNINSCLLGRSKTAFGFIWKYK
jgi:hypothetical protein